MKDKEKQEIKRRIRKTIDAIKKRNGEGESLVVNFEEFRLVISEEYGCTVEMARLLINEVLKERQEEVFLVNGS